MCRNLRYQVTKDKIIQRLKLQKLYLREQRYQWIATPGKLEKLNYVDCIAGYIAKDDKVSIDLLIAANGAQVL